MSERYVLLQTDIADSTALGERLGDAAMSAAWSAHDRMARDLIRHWNGVEVDKSDGFLLLFSDASDAVLFALEYQRKLAELDVVMKARTGIHVGTVTLRKNSDEDVGQGAKRVEVDGAAKPVVARMMSVAVPGQTLLCAEVKATLGSKYHFSAHGHWRFKGIAEPFEIFEIAAEGAAAVSPPDSEKGYRVSRQGDLWLPRRAIKHSLPAASNSFVGRAKVLRQVMERLEAGVRFVSLVGIGGTGKTRLAQRIGWLTLGDYPGGVWFCDLSEARSLEGVLHAVAIGLDVPLGRLDPLVQLGSAIHGRGRCLVIFDNFEQVAKFSRSTLAPWLDRAAEAQFVVTTREVLGLPGELVISLDPMDFDDGKSLFLDRAIAARSDLLLDAEDQLAIGKLVALLDGLPLAIELAAARVRLWSPRLLLARMKDRFKLLAARTGRPDRQSTLRATLDWSWDLLSPLEQMAFAQLSVFRGGFTLDAVDEVLAFGDAHVDCWKADLVQALLEKSLVRSTGNARFDMLLSVREYAESRWLGSLDAAATPDDALTRHCRYFSNLTERQAIANGCADLENVVVACQRAAANGEFKLASRALVNAWSGLRMTGPFQIGVDLARAVRSAFPGAQFAMPEVDWAEGNALSCLGDIPGALARFDQGLKTARSTGTWEAQGRILWSLGEAHIYAQGGDAGSELSEALACAERAGERDLQMKVLSSRGVLSARLGQTHAAEEAYRQALDIARATDDSRRQGGLLGNLGILLYERGLHAEARANYEEALELVSRARDRQWEGNTRCNLGLLLYECDAFAEARVQLDLALQTAREIGDARLECIALCNLGLIAEAGDDLRIAFDTQNGALRLAMGLNDRPLQALIHAYLAWLHAREGRVDEMHAHLATVRGEFAVPTDGPIAALLSCSEAYSAHKLGDMTVARQARVEAEPVAAKAGRGSDLGRAWAALSGLPGLP